MFVFQAPQLRPTMLASAVAALALLSGCGRPGAGDAHASNGPPPAPEVQVAELALQAIRPWDEFNGRIDAVDSVQLRPRVSGYIERIAFSEGQEVRKGQLLFVIDQRPYRAALASAQAVCNASSPRPTAPGARRLRPPMKSLNAPASCCSSRPDGREWRQRARSVSKASAAWP